MTRTIIVKPDLSIWRLIASVVGGLWVTSLALPVTVETDLSGLLILMLGWVGLAAGQFGWLANLSLAWAVFLLVSDKAPSWKVALISTFLLVGPLISSFWWNGAGEMETPEALQDLTYGPGRYVWIASLILAAAAIVLRASVRREIGPAEG